MRSPEPILVAHLFQPINDELVALLRGLTSDEWNAPTVAGAWTVKDVASHLLDTTLRRLSTHRDRYSPPLKFEGDLAKIINELNAGWVAVSRRLSPAELIDMHERYGRQMAEFMTTIDPFAKAPFGVSWAGEEDSLNWFDTARELTEKWHHQQQIRDAVRRPPLAWLAPVIDTFMRALPFAYRDVNAPSGTVVTVNVDDASWTLVRDGGWTLFIGDATKPTTRVTISGDTAWRLFTKGLKPAEGEKRSRVEGEPKFAEAVFKMLAIVA